MSKTITPDITADDDTDYEATVNEMFAEMKRANEKMMRDQDEIDKLNLETNEILARLKAA
ncbi:MAG: hypothetical protein MSG64_01205 [Pyrinomonadaceae bacterium MAG19_C2-C3]|nr:hypothetical protein [Pyrinomonadaceae bacterium MAG19_C2-C3]